MMTVSEIMEKMIVFSNGNIHDIDHLIRVWTYAKTIGELEALNSESQFILEVAAITHDIACPLCREKYGNTNGKHQEIEGAVMVREFLADAGITEEQTERVAFLVGHHHTFTGIDGSDYQILIEADYIANASENNYSRTNVENFLGKIAKTSAGKRLIEEILLSCKNDYPDKDEAERLCDGQRRNIDRCGRTLRVETMGIAMHSPPGEG